MLTLGLLQLALAEPHMIGNVPACLHPSPQPAWDVRGMRELEARFSTEPASESMPAGRSIGGLLELANEGRHRLLVAPSLDKAWRLRPLREGRGPSPEVLASVDITGDGVPEQWIAHKTDENAIGATMVRMELWDLVNDLRLAYVSTTGLVQDDVPEWCRGANCDVRLNLIPDLPEGKSCEECRSGYRVTEAAEAHLDGDVLVIVSHDGACPSGRYRYRDGAWVAETTPSDPEADPPG